MNEQERTNPEFEIGQWVWVPSDYSGGNVVHIIWGPEGWEYDVDVQPIEYGTGRPPVRRYTQRQLIAA